MQVGLHKRGPERGEVKGERKKSKKECCVILLASIRGQRREKK